MKMFLTFVIGLTILMLAVVRLHGGPQAPARSNAADQKRLGQMMELKLEHAKGILEGLATEDYAMMAEEAQTLKALSLESSWNVHTTQEYLEQSADFRRTLQVITDSANDRNLDRAALGYVDLTVRCIECHRYLRKHHAK